MTVARTDPRYGEWSRGQLVKCDLDKEYVVIADLAVALGRSNASVRMLLERIRRELPHWKRDYPMKLWFMPKRRIRVSRRFWIIKITTVEKLFYRELALQWHREQQTLPKSVRIASPYDRNLLPFDRWYERWGRISWATSSTPSILRRPTLRRLLNKQKRQRRGTRSWRSASASTTET